jgi:serine/threonine-protein kinase
MSLPDRLQAALSVTYTLERELGGGGMSRVFLAVERSLNRQIVVKLLPPELASAVSTDRFRQEIRLAARLQHPHIVPLLSAGEADGLLYYTMPLVEGESLRSRLERTGELPVREAMRILRDVAAGLAYAHEHGVVHRDIKPDNVLLTGGEALVTDFGVAKALSAAATAGESGLTSLGVALGTPAYMAPEQGAADPHVDHRADLYAWGCLAYECLTGDPPFTGRQPAALLAAHISAAPEPVERRRAGLPAALAALVMRCLEKRPADRPQSAGELLQVLETAVTPSSGTAPTVPVTSGSPTTVSARPTRRWGFISALLLVVGAAAAVAWSRRAATASPLDQSLVAIAPFDVLDPKLALWHEGMVDVLSRSLDGAGPLRTVSPSIVVQRWKGRADRASAAALGKATGAGLVVFGALQTGGDSVRVDATLFDARRGRTLGEITRRESQSRLDRLGDSLTVALLIAANQADAAATLRTGGVGGRSLPALKAYLRSEQEFRRARWDSARASLEETLRIDSAFPLALRRLSQVYGWIGYAGDSLAAELSMHAGALNHGLGTRDSLLVLTDSLMGGVIHPGRNDPVALQRRLLLAAAEAVRRYPDDPEAWMAYGESFIHYGNSTEASERDAVRAFMRSIALDPEYAPAYWHVVDKGLRVFGPDTARRYAEKMLALRPEAETAGALRTILLLLGPHATPESLSAIVRREPGRVLQQASNAFAGYPDTLDRGLVLLRGFATKAPSDWGEWVQVRVSITERLYGRLDASHDLLTQTSLPWFTSWSAAEEGMLRGKMPAAYQVLYDRSLSGPYYADSIPIGRFMVAVWAEAGDTVHLRRLAHITDSLARLSAATATVRRAPRLVHAFLSLARRDSTTALAEMLALPDSEYDDAFLRFTRANLLVATGRDAEAAKDLENPYVLDWPVGLDGLRMMQRGRVAERLGRREVAMESYHWVANVWHHADPELQPYVAEARAGLTRLTAERP